MSNSAGKTRRKSGSKSKSNSNGSPPCAKIWDFIYGLGGDYEQYAQNIMDICARDSLSDHKGLTVIIPNPEFREEFHEKIHGKNASVSTAKRLLRNTIIKRWLDSAGDFNKQYYYESLPIASGLMLPVVKIEGDVVVLADNVRIKKRDDFGCPAAYNYAVWEVVSGKYSTDTSFEAPRRSKDEGDKSKSKGGGTISGGGSKQKFIINIGKRLKNSSDARRISMIANILGQYRSIFISNKDQVNPLLEKGTSLYNWLYMYAPDVYQQCLIVTDIHPGINLLMLILDPHSPVTDELLFGDPSGRNVESRNGWNAASVTTNSHAEWQEHIDRASRWTNDERGYLKALQRIRRNFSGKRGGSDVRSLVMSYYNDPISVIKDYVDPSAPSVLQALQDWYGIPEFKYRKLWQDEFRLLSLIHI